LWEEGHNGEVKWPGDGRGCGERRRGTSLKGGKKPWLNEERGNSSGENGGHYQGNRTGARRVLFDGNSNKREAWETAGRKRRKWRERGSGGK